MVLFANSLAIISFFHLSFTNAIPLISPSNPVIPNGFDAFSLQGDSLLTTRSQIPSKSLEYLPFNAAHPGSTPLFHLPTAPHTLSASSLDQRFRGGFKSFSRKVGKGNSFITTLNKRDVNANCLDSTASDTLITSMFLHGGANFTVVLCPRAVINISGDGIHFTADDQALITLGLPTGSDRATLFLTNANLTTAIFGYYNNRLNLRNVIVNGNRSGLGRVSTGGALIEMGGNTVDQIIDGIWAFDPRGWSALHGIEGYNNQCRRMQITNNQIGPAGHAPTTGLQFRKRDSTGQYGPGQWADGISIACPQSVVTGNTITDATDGMIVCFTCQSLIADNTIISSDRQALGGINLVDNGPNAGNYTGTVVRNNQIISQSNFIKIGIAVGTQTWDDHRTPSMNFGGTIIGNTLSSGPNGYFGYGISVGGQQSASVSGNTVTTANFGGQRSNVCFSGIPTSQAFVVDKTTTTGTTVQPEFNSTYVQFMICQEPGAITRTGLNPTTKAPNNFSSTSVPSNDLSLNAIATSSSQNSLSPASAAIDGKIGGFTQTSSSQPSQEWTTAQDGITTNQWITLTWPQPVVISSIILFDRPNLQDQVTSGQLNFTDGTVVYVSSLTNDGSGDQFTIPNVVTTAVTFTILQTSSLTRRSGLSEFVVLGSTQVPVSSSSIQSSTSTISASTSTSSTSISLSSSSSSTISSTTITTNTATSSTSVSSTSTTIASITSTSISTTSTTSPITTTSTLSSTIKSSSTIVATTTTPTSTTKSSSTSSKITTSSSSPSPSQSPTDKKPAAQSKTSTTAASTTTAKAAINFNSIFIGLPATTAGTSSTSSVTPKATAPILLSNLAPWAKIRVSSFATNSDPKNVLINDSSAWTTQSGLSGSSWMVLDWSDKQAINSIKIIGLPDMSILKGSITFTDQSSVPLVVQPGATQFNFPNKWTTSIIVYLEKSTSSKPVGLQFISVAYDPKINIPAVPAIPCDNNVINLTPIVI